MNIAKVPKIQERKTTGCTLRSSLNAPKALPNMKADIFMLAPNLMLALNIPY